MDSNTRSSLEAFGDVLNDLEDLHKAILETVIPAQALQHFRSSRREALLGLRTVLDRSIEKLAEQASTDSPTVKKSSRSIYISE
ncbi:MAG: hypothetical protein K0Q73_7572 [Paenibacillus sp.]|jgi:DNA polymerase III alpha subunit|nr:hypothetical protein [Paenibacillus sp.]